jgi:hypothetical protein
MSTTPRRDGRRGIEEARRRFGARAVGPAAPDQPLPEPLQALVDDTDNPDVARRPKPDPSQGSRQTQAAATGHGTGLDGYAAAISRFGADRVRRDGNSFSPDAA